LDALLSNPRGLIIASWLATKPGGHRKGWTKEIDPSATRADWEALKVQLALWDRFAVRSWNIPNSGLHPRLQALVELGVLQEVTLPGSQSSDPPGREAELAIFDLMETREPGLWSLSSQYPTLDFPSSMRGRTLLVRLHEALPIVIGNVPYNEIIDFRRQYIVEARRLYASIEGLYRAILDSSDQPAACAAAFDALRFAALDYEAALVAGGFRLRFVGLEARLKWTVGWEKTVLGAVACNALGYTDITHMLLGSIVPNFLPTVELTTGGDFTADGRAGVPLEYAFRVSRELG